MARWTKEACAEAAAPFTSRGAFKRAYPSAYTLALKHRWMNDICGHMSPGRRMGLSKEQLREIAKGYETRTEFMRGDGGAHRRALDNGWLDDVCAHMPIRRKRWTKEECAVEALKHSTRAQYSAASPSYQTALKRGWLDEVCVHMNHVDRTKWGKGACAALAADYSTRLSFDRAHHVAYEKARREGWLDDICGHMVDGHNVLWTKETCAAEALKYETRTDFRQRSSGACDKAMSKGWFEEVCAHMPIVAGQTPCDVVYIWEADRVRFNGKQVYKVGVAVAHRAHIRMREVSAQAGFTRRVIGVWHVGSTEARQLEKRVHGIGDDPQLTGFDGATEFRAMDDAELSAAIEMLK